MSLQKVIEINSLDEIYETLHELYFVKEMNKDCTDWFIIFYVYENLEKVINCNEKPVFKKQCYILRGEK